ncbi:MAG: hypothetical protein LBL58_12860 [Tannerellaceae bacterium]|nr:hypothetical protein [Tannerellaceae bacterium]
MFDHVHEQYADYLNKSKSGDVGIELDAYKSWSVRKSSHSNIAKKVFENMKKDKMSFSLHAGGIYMEEYELEKQTYQVAVYSKKTAIELSQDIRIASYSALRNNKSIKAGYRDGEGFGLIVFYDNAGAMQMVIQVMGGSDPETMTSQWMNYLGLILPSEEQKKADKTLTQKLVSVALLPLEILMKIWGNDWEKLMEKEVLTPQEIAEARKEIEKIEDEEERGEAYLKLQEKVPFHNQRDNAILGDEYDHGYRSYSDDREGKTIGEVMCNLTSQAMCLEMLGIGVEDACPNSSYTQLEDCLEQIKRDLGYKGAGEGLSESESSNDREWAIVRNKIAQQLNVEQGYKSDVDVKKSSLKPFIENLLKQGYGVMFSLNGHFVRCQGTTEDNLIIDDPYGQQKMLCPKRQWESYNGTTNSENQPGENTVMKWTDIENCSINYIEWYKPKN